MSVKIYKYYGFHAFTVTPSKCDYGDGWYSMEEACWKLFKHKKMAWNDAK